MIPRGVRGFLDRRLSDRRRDPVDQQHAAMVADGIIRSNDGRYVDAVVDGHAECIGGSSARRLPLVPAETTPRPAVVPPQIADALGLPRTVAVRDAVAVLLGLHSELATLRAVLSDAHHAYGRASATIAAERGIAARLREQLRARESELAEAGEALGFGPTWDPHAVRRQLADMARAYTEQTGRYVDQIHALADSSAAGAQSDRPAPAAETHAAGSGDPADTVKVGEAWRPVDSGHACWADVAAAADAGRPDLFYVCTRHLGHDGQHVGSDHRGKVLAVAPNPDLIAPFEREAIDSGRDRPDATWTPEHGWVSRAAAADRAGEPW